MAEKTLNSRIIHKHDTEENWLKATNFTPKQGEIIVYDIDASHTYERFKIGDGKTLVSALPFADDAIGARIDLLSETVDGVSLDVAEVSALVGDTSVSEQITKANMIYVGPNEPTDTNIKVWINTAEEGTGVVPVLPRIATITLAANAWAGTVEPYSQVVEINTVTTSTKIDLQPNSQQIVSLQNAEISLMVENSAGAVTCYAIGNKPTVDYTMQVLLQEVSYV